MLRSIVISNQARCWDPTVKGEMHADSYYLLADLLAMAHMAHMDGQVVLTLSVQDPAQWS